jgi:5-methyltetrahydrofolate--homocysteine methyltransferase
MNLEDFLKGGIRVADGAWGTRLQALGLQAGECPELWNETRAEAVRTVPLEYLEAGAEMIKTNSFGANAARLSHFNLEGKAFALAKRAAEISRAAALAHPHKEILVAGSVGPTGNILMMEEATVEETIAAFIPAIEGLTSGGADAILIETFSELREIDCALAACRQAGVTDIICSAVFQKVGEGEFRTMMGETIEDFYHIAVSQGAVVLGTNCGNGFADVVPIIRQLRGLDKDIPLIALPNAGLPQVAEMKIVYPESPEMIKPVVRLLIDEGANVIGGCCGTTPAHIAAIRAVVSG